MIRKGETYVDFFRPIRCLYIYIYIEREREGDVLSITLNCILALWDIWSNFNVATTPNLTLASMYGRYIWDKYVFAIMMKRIFNNIDALAVIIVSDGEAPLLEI